MIVRAEHSPNKAASLLTGRDYLSYSAVTTYQQCPLRYYFRYVAALPEDAVSASLAFGSGVHAAVELWFNQRMAGNLPLSHDELLDAFWDCWQAKGEEGEIRFGTKEDANTIGHLADRVLKTFWESPLAHVEGQIIGVEEELRGAIASELPDLLARIDLIVETTDALNVIDFKTSRSRWSSDQAASAGEQLLLYSELARQLSPEKQLRLQFAVITKTKGSTLSSPPRLALL